MKIFKWFIGVFIFISLIACKKSDKAIQAPTQETPLQNLVTTKFLDTIQVVNNGKFEEGFSFSTSKNGKITKLGCYMPNNLTYRVTIWDSATQTFTQTAVKVTDSTKFNYVDITPIYITANRTYYATINNTVGGVRKNDFRLGKKPNINFNYPIKSGSISMKAYVDNIGCNTTCFPNNMMSYNISLYGVPDFVFEPEN